MKGTFDYVKTVPKSHFPRGLSPAGLNCAHFFQEFLLTSFLYYLLTENEVFTGKSQTETLPCDKQGRGVIFSHKDRTYEVNKLFIL